MNEDSDVVLDGLIALLRSRTGILNGFKSSQENPNRDTYDWFDADKYLKKETEYISRIEQEIIRRTIRAHESKPK